jgi:hypothetical protein
MTELRVGNITCQIAGQVVPVAEFTLADGDTIFFEQHTLLWKERTVSLTGKNLRAAGQRTVAGMPHAVIEARGPGRMAVTRDASGEAVVLPLHPRDYGYRGSASLGPLRQRLGSGFQFRQLPSGPSLFHPQCASAFCSYCD